MKSITLEMSLKPFKKTTHDCIKNTCRLIFEQWKPLLKHAEEVSVMLWTADGSEILDYSGNIDEKIEWAYYMGTANRPLADATDRPDTSLHEKKRYYMKNPPVITYGILKEIVHSLKEEGKKAFPNAKIRVGETFDIGPEFAASDFKYNRHTEICTGRKLDTCGFIDATAKLNGDSRSYAAYPNGIPEATPFGLFLGKQSQIFLTDMGFDYIWLSNGLGFSAEPWDMTGKIFDGEKFHPEKLEKVKKEVFEFWKYFREGCPNFEIQTRGTNNSVGIDYATDGVPLYDIYNGNFNITPPPNSPWAALNDNVGLELMGHMSRICELPSKDFMFRYYIHDPWWVNSPWYDRYGGNPYDIYLPLAISRIDENGSVQNAEMLNILTIDNSFGDMPDNCVNEPLPHLLKAIKDESDRPSPFVWVYPMREFTQSSSEALLDEMYFGDRFVEDSINRGFPLNCVVSSDNFIKHNDRIYDSCVIISPIPLDKALANKLNSFAENGASVIVYGKNQSLITEKLNENICYCDINEGITLSDTVKNFGFEFNSSERGSDSSAVVTINRSNNAFWFSIYNRDTTAEYSYKFPIGAPILLNGETKIKNGYSTYHFSKSEHRECRFFVKQQNGKIRAKESACVSEVMRRRLILSGLENADVYYFPEDYSVDFTFVSNTLDACRDATPKGYFHDFKVVDTNFGKCVKLENISGDLVFHMPRKSFTDKKILEKL